MSGRTPEGRMNSSVSEPAVTSSPQAGVMLVVDDCPISRLLLSRRVTNLGHQAITAANGREALEKLRTQTFDLVMLDIEMPEMDGRAVLDQMKADPALRAIPVIMVSGVGEIDSVVHAIAH